MAMMSKVSSLCVQYDVITLSYLTTIAMLVVLSWL
jgi:hypothetical protein